MPAAYLSVARGPEYLMISVINLNDYILSTSWHSTALRSKHWLQCTEDYKYIVSRTA